MAATVQQNFVPRDFEVFVGLDVDKKRIVGTVRDHGSLLKSLQLPYSAEQLLRYTEKHHPGRKVAFVYEAGPTGFGSMTASRWAIVAWWSLYAMVPQAPGNV
jgi:hypothetical protein